MSLTTAMDNVHPTADIDVQYTRVLQAARLTRLVGISGLVGNIEFPHWTSLLWLGPLTITFELRDKSRMTAIVMDGGEIDLVGC